MVYCLCINVQISKAGNLFLLYAHVLKFICIDRTKNAIYKCNELMSIFMIVTKNVIL